MGSVFYVGAMVVLWVVNLLNGTGLGSAYHTTEYARTIIACLAVFAVLNTLRTEKGLPVRQRYFHTTLPLLVIFLGVSLVKHRALTGLEYLWAFLVVFLLSKTHPRLNTLRLTGFAYGALGLMILAIFQFTDILKGWNPNSIAMIGLFSFLVFIIPFYGARDFRSFMMLTLVGCAYVYLIWPTDSRASAIAIVIALLLSFRIVSIERILASRIGLLISLLVPLFIVMLICAVSESGIATELEAWSLEKFNKPLFNGRDTVWLEGLEILSQNFLFGTGQIYAGYWHNSAIACLVAYGSIGYLLWIRLFHLILGEGSPYIRDVSIAGSMTAFLVVFWQQSVELGLFAPNPNLLPYAMLGILLGRVNALRSESQW